MNDILDALIVAEDEKQLIERESKETNTELPDPPIWILADAVRELAKALRQTTEMVLGEFTHPSCGEEAVFMGKLTASDIHLLRAANYELFGTLQGVDR